MERTKLTQVTHSFACVFVVLCHLLVNEEAFASVELRPGEVHKYQCMLGLLLLCRVKAGRTGELGSHHRHSGDICAERARKDPWNIVLPLAEVSDLRIFRDLTLLDVAGLN